jgi:hypothetical protein
LQPFEDTNLYEVQMKFLPQQEHTRGSCANIDSMLFRKVIATYGILNTHTRHMNKMHSTLMSLSGVTVTTLI